MFITVSHVCIFDPASWTVNYYLSNLLSGSTPPLPCVNTYTVYMYTMFKMVEGQINRCRKVLLKVNLLDDDICIAFYASYLYSGLAHRTSYFSRKLNAAGS
jgi:hypothetical protein